MVKREVTAEQSKDAGMAFVLILLLVWAATRGNGFIFAAMAVHVLNMIAPQLFRPAAVVWFGVSHLLGTVVSKLVLSIVFFGILTPVGVVRRWMGKDSLQLRVFRAGTASVMTERNHTYGSRDIELPY